MIKIITPLAVIIVAVLLAMMMINSKTEPQKEKSTALVPMVHVVEVEKTAVPITVTAYGTVAAKKQVDLSSELTGVIVWVSEKLDTGIQVKQGVVLLRIDPVDYQVALSEAEAALANAELALSDAKTLKRSAAVTEANFRVEAARQRVRKAQNDLSKTEIKAPFNAMIDLHLVEIGQYITAGTKIAHLLGTDLAEIRLPLTPMQKNLLPPVEQHEGLPVEVSANIGNQIVYWDGQIGRIELLIDEQTRVFSLMVEVSSPYDRQKHAVDLPFGLFVKVEIPGQVMQDTVRLPRNALHDGEYVYLLVDGKLQRRVVNAISLGNEDSIFVQHDLQDGEMVVLSNLAVMFDGMRIQATHDSTAR